MKARFSLSAVAGVAVALLLAACSGEVVQPVQAPAALAVARAPEQDPVVAGEVIVKLKQGASAEALVRAHGLRLGQLGYQGKFQVVQGARGSERAIAAQLAKDPRVEYAEPNYLRTADAIDSKLWAFYNPGGLQAAFTDRAGLLPATYTSIKDADEDAINNIGAGGSPVVVGDIDTGIDTDHKEFTGRLILGRDWVNNDNLPEDDHGHGTHTAGTIGGSSVGVAGVTGAGTNVKIHVQKVCYPNADGTASCPTTAIVNAIYAAADYPGLVAMNLSLGGGTESTAEKNAIAYATNKGVLVIASAGNSGTAKVGCPACDPNAISVAATNWRDALTYYTNYGRGLDISAPGGELYSNTTDEMGIYSAYLNGGYKYLQGTSMAAPQVTGAAAVVASKTPNRGVALRNRLLTTTDNLGAPGYDTKFGYGRLNVYRAITGNSLGAGQ